MIRIVLDTNVLLSALLNPQGAPAQVLLLTILEPDIHLCVSGEIFAEYEEVLHRPKFSRGRSEIDGALRSIRENGLWVKPMERCVPAPIQTTIFSLNAPKPPVHITW